MVQSFAGPIIPWVLDDFDPKTTDDQQINARIDDAVQRLDQILSRQGLKKDSPEYQERLAVGLFYFVYFPKPDTNTRERLLQVSKELQAVGLNEFKNFLFQKGGLENYILSHNGVSAATTGQFTNRTGLEALRSRQGMCAENSEILFAVFRRAKLNPEFVYIKDTTSEFTRRGIPIPRDQKGMEHICIRLSFGKKSDCLI